MKKRFVRTQHDLAAALHTLRILVREVGGNYLATLQSEVAHMEQLVKNANTDGVPDRKQLAQMSAMLKWVTALDVRPQKGRRRDLKEIDRLITKLSDVMETW